MTMNVHGMIPEGNYFDNLPEIPQFTPQSSLNPAEPEIFSPTKPSVPSARFNHLSNESWSEAEVHTSDDARWENSNRFNVQQLESEADFFRLFELKSETLGLFGTARLGKKRHRLDDPDVKKRHVGRAVLHEARDRRTWAPRVVKIIDKGKLPASAGGEHLWRRLCRKLLEISPKHNGLMTVTDIFETPERFYIVSENLEGGELFEFLLHEKAVPEELCKYIIKQILQALDFLHSNFLLHRDVKPENLMFRRARPTTTVDPGTTSLSLASTASSLTFDQTSSDKPTTRVMSSLECSQTMPLHELSRLFELAVIDFDTCKMMDAPPSEYREICNGRRRLVGTYGYLAPEVLKGHEYTRVSDLWSVGVILYILMTGVPPVPMDLMVNARTSLDVLLEAKREGIDFNLAPFPEFPKAQDLCRLLLEFDATKRMASARQALEHPWLWPAASNAVPLQLPPSAPPFGMLTYDFTKRRATRPTNARHSPRTAKYTDQNYVQEQGGAIKTWYSPTRPFSTLFGSHLDASPQQYSRTRRPSKCASAMQPASKLDPIAPTPRLPRYTLGLFQEAPDSHRPTHSTSERYNPPYDV